MFSVDQQKTAEKRKLDFFFQSLNHVDFYLKLQFLIKSGYYIVLSPSTALKSNDNVTQKMQAKMDVDYLGHASTILKVSEKF